MVKQLIVASILSLILPAAGVAQQRTNRSKLAPPPSYVGQTLVPSNVREFLLALGDRFQKPGKERLTLVGKHTDKSGTVSAQLTWEVPGRVRFDRGGTQPLVFDDVLGVVNPGSLKDSDLGILESLVHDGPEAFLYGFVQGHAHRFLGGRFRTDNGKTPNYQGPWFDIYETVAPIRVLSGAPLRQKFFYFDSRSKLFVKTRYLVLRNGAKVSVSTEYDKWTAKGGQAIPGRIVRKEDGAPVFTFDVAAASVGPVIGDGLFPKH